jgi:hypothetical protein
VLEYCAKSELHPRSGLGLMVRQSPSLFSLLTSHVSQASRVSKYIAVGGARSGQPARAMGVVTIAGIKA